MVNISKSDIINIAMTKLKIKSSAIFSSFTHSTTPALITPWGEGRLVCPRSPQTPTIRERV